jgi:hypothetical protein
MWSYSLAFLNTCLHAAQHHIHMATCQVPSRNASASSIRFSEPACIAIHVSQSKPHAIRNLLRLLKMQVNIPERNNGNYGNFGDFSNFATLASFRHSQDLPTSDHPITAWAGRYLGSRVSIQSGFGVYWDS